MSNFFKFFNLVFLFSIFSFFSSFHFANAEEVFVSDLHQGVRSEEVRFLQKLLNIDPSTRVTDFGVGSPGLETDFFGGLTKNAVIRFQEKYSNDILSPLFLNKGTGFVGQATRKKLNLLITSFNFDSKSKVETLPALETSSLLNKENNTYPQIDNFPKEVKEGERIRLTGKNLKNTGLIKVFLEREYNIIPENVTDNSFEFVFSTPLTKSIKKELYAFSDLKVRKIVFDAMKESFKSESKQNLEIGVSISILNDDFNPINNKSVVSFSLNK